MAIRKPRAVMTLPDPEAWKLGAARIQLTPIALPESLNDYFADVIPNMGNVFRFMRKYMSDDSIIKKLIDTYDALPPFRKQNPDKIDLDYLAEKAKVEKIIIRERVLIAASRYGESKIKLSVALHGPEIIDTIIAIALDPLHPDGQACRDMLAQNLGVKALPKSAQIVINNNQQTNNLEASIGVPSLHETIGPIEARIKAMQEKKLLEDKQSFIDIDEVEEVDKEEIELALIEGEDYITEDEVEEDD